MPEYENLTKEELEFADHYFESGNFEGLAKMQKLSAERAGKGTKHISPNTVLSDHIVKDATEK